MKKRVVISLATAALLSTGVLSVGQNSGLGANLETVQAAKKTYSIKLRHNAYVYNKHGKRKGRKALKKNRTLVCHGITKIKGKKYYHISKGRYIKAANVAKANSANKSKDYTVVLTSNATVYNSKGLPTNITLKKGLMEEAHGITKIHGQQFYKLGGNHYILTSTARINDSIAKTPISDTDHKLESTDTNNSSISDMPGKDDKPTKEEIKHLLANSNDKLGYKVYFSDSELAQIKNSLWNKIQNYRVQQGYEPYKSNPELDSFIGKVSSTANNMFFYSEDINNQDIAKYLPTLSSKGMNAVQAFDHYKYYGHYLGAPAKFNIKDRNPEHVATEIFNSLKDDPFYESKIVGLFDNKAFGSLALNYNWDGNYSTVGLVFIEVAGTSKDWSNYYNAN